MDAASPQPQPTDPNVSGAAQTDMMMTTNKSEAVGAPPVEETRDVENEVNTATPRPTGKLAPKTSGEGIEILVSTVFPISEVDDTAPNRGKVCNTGIVFNPTNTHQKLRTLNGLSMCLHTMQQWRQGFRSG